MVQTVTVSAGRPGALARTDCGLCPTIGNSNNQKVIPTLVRYLLYFARRDQQGAAANGREAQGGLWSTWCGAAADGSAAGRRSVTSRSASWRRSTRPWA